MSGTADSIMFVMKREKGKVFGEWGKEIERKRNFS